MPDMVKADAAAVESATAHLTRVRAEISKIIVGQQDVVDGVLICLLAGGHVLLEGVPGLGKTTLLRTLARVLHLKYSRIQFTPDLMPADIVGSMIMETDERGQKRCGSSPARSSPTWCWPTRSTAPRPRPNPLCSRRCRSAPSPAARPPMNWSRRSGDGDPESDRNGRHLSASRSPARPLPDEDSGGLSLARRAEPHRRAHHPAEEDETVGRCWTAKTILESRAVCRQVLVAPHVQEHAIDLVMATQPGSAKRTSWPTSTSATAARRAARRRWWNAAACWR